MTPEGKIKAQLKKRVIETGGRIRYLRWLGRRSALDTFVWMPAIPGRPYRCAFVEVKDGNAPYQPGQEREIERMHADGFPAWTLRSLDEIELFVSWLTAPN